MNESSRIKVCNREPNENDHFKFLGKALRTDDYCTKQIKIRIVIVKETFNRKISLFTSKLNIEYRNKFVWCYV